MKISVTQQTIIDVPEAATLNEAVAGVMSGDLGFTVPYEGGVVFAEVKDDADNEATK